MTKEQFEEKLPIVLEALKKCIDNELGNNYDYNFNSYFDLISGSSDLQTLELFLSYGEAIDEVENNLNSITDNANVILDALKDYSLGGYKFTEEDDGFELDETPFTDNEEMQEFIEYLTNKINAV